MIPRITTDELLSLNRLVSSLCFILLLSLFCGNYGQAQILQFPLHGNPHKCDMQASLDDLSLFCGGNQICISVAGGKAPYTVFLNHDLVDTDAEASELELCFTDLAPGKYKLRIRDAMGCNAKLRFFIPEEVLQAKVTPVHCGAEDNGAISIKLPFELDDLQFNWTGPAGFSAEGSTITGLTAGNYNVEVSTQTGLCVAQGSWTVEVNEPVALEVITTETDEDCPTSTNTCLSVSGGSGKYRIWAFTEIPEGLADAASGQIENFDIVLKGGKKYHPQGEDDQLCMDQIPTGTYQILVVDTQGCFAWTTVDVDNPALRMSVKADRLGCNDEDALGEVCYKLTGGTAPYTVSLQIDGEPASAETADCFADLPAGEYTLVATDATGCTVEKTVAIEHAEPLEAYFQMTGKPCDGNGGCVRVKGGHGPYRFFAWRMDAAPEDLPSITFDDEGIPMIEGMETLTFPLDQDEDQDDQDEDQDDQDEDQDDQDDQDEDQDEDEDYDEDEDEEDDDEEYEDEDDNDEYDDDEEDDSHQGVGARRCARNIPAGYYLILVIDGNDCQTTLEIDIPETEAFEVEAEATQPTEGQADGSITLHISGGQAPYAVSINGQNAAMHEQTEIVIGDLAAGKYHLEVSDAGGCTEKVRVRLGKEQAESACFGGSIELSSASVASGEVVSAKLVDYAGQKIRWQIKTEETEWKTLPGKIGDEITTPPLVAAIDQNVRLRAVVTCHGNSVEFSEEAEILVSAGSGITEPDDEDAGQLLALSPNPSQGQMQIRFKTDFPAGTVLQVRTATGMVMHQQQTGEVRAGAQMSIDLSQLPSGLYYLSLENKQQRHYQRIMLQR